MLFLDALFRFSGLGMLVVLAVCSWHSNKNWSGRPYLILSCISVGALFIGYAPKSLQPPEPLLTIARFADIPSFILVWLFTLSLFEKSFRLSNVHIIVGMVFCAPIVWLRLHEVGVLPPLPDWIIVYGVVTSAMVVGHLCFATLGGRMDDLVQARRAARIQFVIVLSLCAIAAALSELVPDGPGYIHPRTSKVITIWPVILWGSIWMLSFDAQSVRFSSASPRNKGGQARDRELRAKLEMEMNDGEAFRDASLTIVALALRLGVNQHRLRALINQDMGYQNFSAFVNEYRIEAVKRVLASKDNDHLPILTIAMDAGFKSLSPFNRAFREIVGVTPTAFRKSSAES